MVPIKNSPPERLSARTRQLWDELAPDIDSLAQMALLTEALQGLTRVDYARQILKVEKLTTTLSTRAVHAHPAARVEQDAMGLFMRMWQSLGSDKPSRAGPLDFSGITDWPESEQ